MTTTAYAHNVEWLLAAAARLEANGEFALAAEARAEAALPPRPVPVPVVIRCDACNARVTSARQIDKYDAMGVDWAMCARCER